MCNEYKILSDNVAHTHCLPDPETLNVGTWVECTALRLQEGVNRPCGSTFYVTVEGWGKRKRKVFKAPDYGW